MTPDMAQCPACKGSGEVDKNTVRAIESIAAILGFSVAMPILACGIGGLLLRFGANGYEATGGGCILAFFTFNVYAFIRRCLRKKVGSTK